MSSATAAVRRDDGTFVQSLERGLAVLRVFSAETSSLTLSEVARLAGTSPATARRILHTFQALGYVTNDGRRFELTSKVLDLGYAYLSSLQLGELAQPAMELLSEQVHESVSAAVLDGDEIVYVARVPTTRIMSITLTLGSRLPALTTSLGRVLIADLGDDEIDKRLADAAVEARTASTKTDRDDLRQELTLVRAQGFAVVDEELEIGVRSVAAPLRDRRGRAIAALNIGAQAGRVSMDRLLGEFVPQLLAAATDITALLARR